MPVSLMVLSLLIGCDLNMQGGSQRKERREKYRRMGPSISAVTHHSQSKGGLSSSWLCGRNPGKYQGWKEEGCWTEEVGTKQQGHQGQAERRVVNT